MRHRGLERALYEQIALYFKSQGYSPYVSTVHGDIVAYDQDKDVLVAVEVEPDDSRAAISQALSYKDFADLVYVAVPEYAKLFLDVIKRLGLGLLVIGRKGVISCKVAPAMNQPSDLVLRANLVSEMNATNSDKLEMIDEFESECRRVLELAHILNNDTRFGMLLRLMEQPLSAGHFREKINPKIVYENFSMFKAHHLIRGSENGTYELTLRGRLALREYLAFIKQVQKTLGGT